jgi:hypothetical protein
MKTWMNDVDEDVDVDEVWMNGVDENQNISCEGVS